MNHLIAFTRSILGLLPAPLGERLKRGLLAFYASLPLWILTRRGRWIRSVYWRFGQEQRSYVFLSIARFLNINRPIPGYYFEFGCHQAFTFRQAWNHFHHLFDLH